MTKPKRRRRVWFRRRDADQSNVQAAILTCIGIAVILTVAATMLVQHERFLKSRGGQWPIIAWDPAWPALPTSSAPRSLPTETARVIYAFAATKPEVLQHIPCYCGCKSQGHQSNHDCYIKKRSTNGRVSEWDSHGLTCPVGPDITGDVMAWHEHGTPLATIRRDIDREFGSRGPATATPEPPSHK